MNNNAISQATTLIVVRHGETEWNRDGLQQGQQNSDLTELGIQQAQAVADALEEYSFDAIYCSDLGRAVQTAEIIAEPHKLKLILDTRLRERHLGITQGLEYEQFKAKHPDVFRLSHSSDPDYVIPEGESIRQRTERAVACGNQIAQSHPGGRVLVVTHGGILDGLYRTTLGIPLTEPRRFSLYNAAINRFTIKNSAWQLNTWGDIHHLKDLDTLDDS